MILGDIIVTRDLAALLGVSPITVCSMVRRGQLTPIGRIGRTHIFDLLASAEFAKHPRRRGRKPTKSR